MQTDKQALSPPTPLTIRENLTHLGSRLLPHDTKKTTCPPAPLVSQDGQLIIVPSLMRSGTHLLLDALLNNFPQLRRLPLFTDFDAYERAGLPVAPLAALNGGILKTHYPQTPLRDDYAAALKTLASRAVIFRPARPAQQVRNSLAKWGQNFSPEEFAEVEKRFEDFWGSYSPVAVEFSTLLEVEGVSKLIELVEKHAKFRSPTSLRPIMPAPTRLGVYLDKIMTRAFGCRAPRINTTIGYRLRPKT